MQTIQWKKSALKTLSVFAFLGGAIYVSAPIPAFSQTTPPPAPPTEVAPEPDDAPPPPPARDNGPQGGLRPVEGAVKVDPSGRLLGPEAGAMRGPRNERGPRDERGPRGRKGGPGERELNGPNDGPDGPRGGKGPKGPREMGPRDDRGPGGPHGHKGGPGEHGPENGPHGPRNGPRDRGPEDGPHDRGPEGGPRDRGPRDENGPDDGPRGPRGGPRDRGPEDGPRDRGPHADKGPRDKRGPEDGPPAPPAGGPRNGRPPAPPAPPADGPENGPPAPPAGGPREGRPQVGPNENPDAAMRSAYRGASELERYGQLQGDVLNLTGQARSFYTRATVARKAGNDQQTVALARISDRLTQAALHLERAQHGTLPVAKVVGWQRPTTSMPMSSATEEQPRLFDDLARRMKAVSSGAPNATDSSWHQTAQKLVTQANADWNAKRFEASHERAHAALTLLDAADMQARLSTT